MGARQGNCRNSRNLYFQSQAKQDNEQVPDEHCRPLLSSLQHQVPGTAPQKHEGQRNSKGCGGGFSSDDTERQFHP